MDKIRFRFPSCSLMLYIIMLLFKETVNSELILAQQQVTRGSTRNYSATVNNSIAPKNFNYVWSVTPAGNIVSSEHSTSTDIQWNGTEGLYTITMIEGNGSCTTSNTFQVEILPTPNLSFKYSISNGGCANGDAAIELTFSGASNSIFYPLVINYTLDGGPIRTIRITDETGLNIPIARVDRANRDGSNNYTISVVLLAATANGGFVNLFAPTTNIHTVIVIPQINEIVAN